MKYSVVVLQVMWFSPFIWFAEIIDIFPKSGVLHQWLPLPNPDSSSSSCCADVFFWKNWIWSHKSVRLCFQSHSWRCFTYYLPISGYQCLFCCHRSTRYILSFVMFVMSCIILKPEKSLHSNHVMCNWNNLHHFYHDKVSWLIEVPAPKPYRSMACLC